MRIGKSSGVQVILAQGSGIVEELEWTLDLRVKPLPERSVLSESYEECSVLSTMKDMGVNLVAQPL